MIHAFDDDVLMCGVLAIVFGADVRWQGDASPGEPSCSFSEETEDSILRRAEWFLKNRGPDGRARETRTPGGGSLLRLTLTSSLLQTRGQASISNFDISDGEGNVLLFNGEVYDGLPHLGEGNDGEALLRALGKCETATEVTSLLSGLRGPWSIVYWQKRTETLFYGRDVIGRRSLLGFCGGSAGPPWQRYSVLSSVSLAPLDAPERERRGGREIPPGVYSARLGSGPGCVMPERHAWTDPVPAALASTGTVNAAAEGREARATEEEVEAAAKELFGLLTEAVRLRCSLVHHTRKEGSGPGPIRPAPVAILFSGGLDSAILAGIAGLVCSPGDPIDLVNVCFVGGGSPDRASARSCLLELSGANPSRDFRLIEVDSSLADVDGSRARLLQLLQPAETFMDLNIGAALAMAASAKGRLLACRGGELRVVSEVYESAALVILCGHGADEQAGGYGRHHTKYRAGGWAALAEEIELDTQRLWR